MERDMSGCAFELACVVVMNNLRLLFFLKIPSLDDAIGYQKDETRKNSKDAFFLNIFEGWGNKYMYSAFLLVLHFDGRSRDLFRHLTSLFLFHNLSGGLHRVPRRHGH